MNFFCLRYSICSNDLFQRRGRKIWGYLHSTLTYITYFLTFCLLQLDNKQINSRNIVLDAAEHDFVCMQWSAQLRLLTLSWHSCCLATYFALYEQFLWQPQKKGNWYIVVEYKICISRSHRKQCSELPIIQLAFFSQEVMCWLSRLISFYFVF